MTITATFSNGYTDTYHGDRDVKAAWMVVLPNGKTLSGHSWDAPTALKTARNNAAQRFTSDKHHYQALRGAAKWMHAQKYVRETVARYGFRSWKEHDASLAVARAAFVAQCQIEVVAL